jgi:DNA-binding response OmpR family regulator
LAKKRATGPLWARSDYITKPIDTRTFAATVEAFLAGR